MSERMQSFENPHEIQREIEQLQPPTLTRHLEQLSQTHGGVPKWLYSVALAAPILPVAYAVSLEVWPRWPTRVLENFLNIFQ